MPDYDFQVILIGRSELPKDRYVNTLHFTNIDPGATWSPAGLMDDLATLYQALTPIYSGECRSMEIRAYNPDDPAPREPLIMDFPFVGGGDDGVGEVALCLSYFAGTNQPRNRGRVYMGPFGQSSMWSRPEATVISALMTHAQNLTDLGGANIHWQQVSRVAGTRKQVTDAWVDNAWDTMRSRGLAPTDRETVNFE